MKARGAAGLLALLVLASSAGAQEKTPTPTPTPTPAPVDERLDLKRPGAPETPVVNEIPPIDPSKVPPPEPVLPRESLPIPDRWRILDSLGLSKQRFWDPYNHNVYKGVNIAFLQTKLLRSKICRYSPSVHLLGLCSIAFCCSGINNGGIF